MEMIPGAIYRMDPDCQYLYQGRLFKFICWHGDSQYGPHEDTDFPVMEAVEDDMVDRDGKPIIENGMYAYRYKLVWFSNPIPFNSLL